MTPYAQTAIDFLHSNGWHDDGEWSGKYCPVLCFSKDGGLKATLYDGNLACWIEIYRNVRGKKKMTMVLVDQNMPKMIERYNLCVNHLQNL